MVGFFLLNLLQANKAEAGQAFENCLSVQYNINNPYNLLLGFSFANNIDINNGKILDLCCNNSNCSLISYSSQTCHSTSEFLCSKISQNIFCVDNHNGGICAGIVGDGSIVSNNTLGSCLGKNITNIANYLETVDTYISSNSGGFAYWSCSLNSSCGELWCNWDNGGWTCYDSSYPNNNDVANACFLQWTNSFPASSIVTNLVSRSIMTDGSSITSSLETSTYVPISNHSSNNLSLTETIIIPVATVGTGSVGGLTIYFLIKKRRRKTQQLREEVINLQNLEQERETPLLPTQGDKNEFLSNLPEYLQKPEEVYLQNHSDETLFQKPNQQYQAHIEVVSSSRSKF